MEGFMKIKLHDNNESIIDLDLVIFMKKDEDTIYIQDGNTSIELDYSDIKDDYKEEKTTLERDYELIYKAICTDVLLIKDENEALKKNLENNRKVYEKLYEEYNKEVARANLDWIRADDKEAKIKKAINYINDHKILKRKELLKILK